VIVKARAGQGGPRLARYLASGKNDRAEVLELRHLAAVDLRAAVREMDDVARGSACEKHALHVQMRAAPGESVTPEQWLEATDRYAARFGMEDHQAAVVLHRQPDGTTHCHIVFNRVHPETLRAASLSWNYVQHKQLARELERDFGLRRLQDKGRDQQRPSRHTDGGRGEFEQARRRGRDAHAVRDRIREAWGHSDDGRSFAAALDAAGFILARGERRDYVAVDDVGGVYSIGRRTTGATAREVRERLADLDPDRVPDVEQARTQARERLEARPPAPAPAVSPPGPPAPAPTLSREREGAPGEQKRADIERALQAARAVGWSTGLPSAVPPAPAPEPAPPALEPERPAPRLAREREDDDERKKRRGFREQLRADLLALKGTAPLGSATREAWDASRPAEVPPPAAPAPSRPLRPSSDAAREAVLGTLVEHGAAPYRFDPGNEASYYLRLRLDNGRERTFWGLGLEEALNGAQTHPAVGDTIGVRVVGQREVTLTKSEVDEHGQRRDKTITAKRNDWVVEQAAYFAEPGRLERDLAARGAALSPPPPRVEPPAPTPPAVEPPPPPPPPETLWQRIQRQKAERAQREQDLGEGRGHSRADDRFPGPGGGSNGGDPKP
jgi:hypothetical protein